MALTLEFMLDVSGYSDECWWQSVNPIFFFFLLLITLFPSTVKSSQDLEDMYRQELEVKRTIVEDVAHHDNRDVLMMYASCWLHQPYIGDEASLILEGMLTETGFRWDWWARHEDLLEASLRECEACNTLPFTLQDWTVFPEVGDYPCSDYVVDICQSIGSTLLPKACLNDE